MPRSGKRSLEALSLSLQRCGLVDLPLRASNEALFNARVGEHRRSSAFMPSHCSDCPHPTPSEMWHGAPFSFSSCPPAHYDDISHLFGREGSRLRHPRQPDAFSWLSRSSMPMGERSETSPAPVIVRFFVSASDPSNSTPSAKLVLAKALKSRHTKGYCDVVSLWILALDDGNAMGMCAGEWYTTA